MQDSFRPNDHYIMQMQRYDILPRNLAPDAPIDYYAADQAYWKSFWYRPKAIGGRTAGSTR